VIAVLPNFSFVPKPAKSILLQKVVIDAGHGGKDPGKPAIKLGGESEKDIALDVALLLGKYIESNFDDVDVIYTREKDVFVELHHRSKIANDNNANLFISIHCNAADNKSACGSETWIMGMHKTDYNLNVAQKENASILLEEDYSENYDNFNPNSPESYIALSLTQDAYNDQSEIFAQLVQEEFASLRRKDRGVKQAGFVVLSRTFMPRVLVELGFITNSEEEQYLTSDEGKKELANAVFNAFTKYKQSYDKKNSIQKKDKIKCDGVNYKIQLKASNSPIALSEFDGINNLYEFKSADMYKYAFGCYKTLKEAEEEKEKLKVKGFIDVFIIAFNNDTKISIKQATLLLKN